MKNKGARRKIAVLLVLFMCVNILVGFNHVFADNAETPTVANQQNLDTISYSDDLCFGGQAYADSVYVINEYWEPSRAFDNNGNSDNSTWHSAGTEGSHWLAYKFPVPKAVCRVSIMTRSGFEETRGFGNFSIQGSNDSTNGNDGTWTDLAKGLNNSGKAGFDVYDFNNTEPFQFIRIIGESLDKEKIDSSSFSVNIGEVEMRELKADSELPAISTTSTKELITTTATPTSTPVRKNLSVNKSSKASSRYYTSAVYEAPSGNDGNTYTLWASNGEELSPWWQVDLGTTCRILSLDMLARQDTDQPDSRNYFEVIASNDSTFEQYAILASAGEIGCPAYGKWSQQIEDENVYRYVRVRRTNNAGHLTFAEFEVWGYEVAVDSTVSLTASPTPETTVSTTVPTNMFSSENSTTIVKISATPVTGANYIRLDWNSLGEGYTYTVYAKGQDENVFQSIPSETNVKVLNIYPDAGDNLKTWMETDGYGKSLISVEKVNIVEFNKNPVSCMKDSNGNWKYNVIYFGAYDCNNNYDISLAAKDLVEEYIKDGYGTFFGHDTMLSGLNHPNFNSLSGYVNINLIANNSYGNTTINVSKEGLLTNYPWQVGGAGTLLTVPNSHSSGQFAMGDIWMKYTSNSWSSTGEVSSLNNKTGTTNFYLTTWNNCAMIQTGHSKGAATEDEQKLLANTLFYLAQLTSSNSCNDHKSQDFAAPDSVSISSALNDSKSLTATYSQPKDNGTEYEYYVKASNDSEAVDITSNTTSAVNTSGIAGYSYAIDNKQDTEPDNKTNTTNLSVSAPLSALNLTQPIYIHIKAIDYAGNCSKTIHYKYEYKDRVSLDQDSIIIKTEAVKQLNAEVTSYSYTNIDVKWISSDETIARVDSKGNVTAVGIGKATITAQINGTDALACCDVNVKNISLDKTSINIQEGESLQLKATSLDNVIWNSSNEKVAEVDSNGKVTAKSSGKAVITAQIEGTDISATCEVTVPDIIKPSVPVNVAVTAMTGKTATISWDASFDNLGVVGYEVLRDGVVAGETDKISYTDTGLTPGTKYSYTVQAIDAAGNKSGISSPLTFVPLKPRISNVSPTDGTTIGGTGSKTLNVYFDNNKNIQGSRAEFEYSTDGTSWSKFLQVVNGPYTSGTSSYFTCGWDLTNVSSGSYMVRFTVFDASDEYDTLTANYQVDRAAPSAPQNLTMETAEGRINLTWSVSLEADANTYRVYRSDSEDGPFSPITTISGKANAGYSDGTVVVGQTYYYRVTASDKFGQESQPSAVVYGVPQKDQICPVVLGIEPLDGNVFGPHAQITVRAEDNTNLSSIKLQYSTDGTNWTDIGIEKTDDNALFNWDTAPIDNKVMVRAIARDSSGNESDGTPMRTYRIDQQGPAQVTLDTPTVDISTVTLRWKDVPDNDFSYFQVERKDTAEGEFKNIGTTNTKLGMNVTELAPDTTYWFRVVAYDKYGNRGVESEILEASTQSDTQAPVITSLQPKPGRYSTGINVSATATDNVGIKSITIQTSSDNKIWTDVETYTPSSVQKTVTFNHTITLTDKEEGPIYVRAVATDVAGNISDTSEDAPFVEHRVDHTAPLMPANFSISVTTGYITLNWDQGTDTDLAYYRLYRADSEIGTYTVIADKLKYISYNDRTAIHGNKYYYKVSAVDTAGNESELSTIKFAQLAEDTERPKVISFSPSESTILPANPTISVLASDNYKLSKINVEYKPENSTEWVLLGSKDLNVYSDAVAFKWDTEKLTDGKYNIRAVAIDQGGNTSEALTTNYSLNLAPPQAPVVSSNSGGWSIDLAWTSGNEEDLAGFRIYRSNDQNGTYKLLKETTSTAYTDTPIMPGINYYYKVESIDKYRNASMSEVITALAIDQDPFAPTAEAGIDMLATVGMETAFDGTGSTDNDKIAAYFWDFGDSGTSNIAQPYHTYNEAGTYTATLTVTDAAGNTATDTLTVTVYDAQQVGTLEVKVVDSQTGVSIPGAYVYVDLPTDDTRLVYANGNGIATVVALAGNYNVSAYKDGYLPKEVNVKVEQYKKTQVTIRIGKGELVVGEINVRRMDLEEIVEAGIDIKAPENQFVYNFEVTLKFNEEPLPVQYIVANGHGKIYSGSTFNIGGSGNGGSSGGTSTIGGTTTQKTVVPKVIPHVDHPEVPPTVACLVIPKYASWLKEFFEVGLVVQNMADPQFVIQNASVILKEVDGLSLAPTAKKQNYTINIGDIAGQESKEAKWIIRGDEKGEYDLEADFYGTLMPFAAPVNANFKTNESFRVWGGDALKIYVMAEDSYYVGYNHYTHFMLVNESDIPIYNIKTNFGSYSEPTPESETIVIYPDGSKRHIYSDGTETAENSNGDKEVVNSDGSKQITTKEGDVQSIARDGVKTITKKDGSQEIITPLADKTESDEYGGKTYRYEDESEEYIKAATTSEENYGVSLVISGNREDGEQTTVPVIRPGDSLGIECLLPGESIMGTYVGTPSVEGEHDPDENYFVLEEAFSTTMPGSNTVIPVTISTIPSHVYKSKVIYVNDPSICADPVDTNTGAHLIEYEALGVNGVTPLTFELDYNSRLVYETKRLKNEGNGKGFDSLSQLGNSTMGNGWSHNYETWLTENKDESITVYWSPYNSTIFYKGNEKVRTVNGTTDKYGNIYVTGEAGKEEALFYSKSEGMKDYVLKRNAEGTYELSCANANKYIFDSNGKLAKLEDRNGHYVTLTRSEESLVICEPASNQTLTVVYNEKGLVKRVEDKTGRKTSFQYDSSNNLTAITDPNEKTSSYTYDSNGYVLSGKDGDNVTYFTNTYDEKARVLTQDDAVAGNELTTFSYDETSEFWRTITTVKDRNGNTSKRIHNRTGHLVRIEDEFGKITTYTYDGDGNRTSISDPKDYTTTYTYDDNSNLLTIEDAEGTATTYTYDAKGNLLTAVDKVNGKIVNTYTDNNLVKTTIDERGIKTTYEYDSNGQIVKKTVDGLGSTSYTYYENGLMKTASDYLGNNYTYEYDDLGRATAVTDREGNTTYLVYDNCGNVIEETDSLGNKVKYTYDSRGNLLTETDSKGNTTTFKYNGNGMLVEVTDSSGKKTTYEYDGEDRQTKITDSEGNVSEIKYDAAGQAIEVKDASGNKISYEYDDNGLLLSEKLPNGGVTEYTYYKNGNVKTATDAAGNTSSYKYDVLWRVSSIVDAKGKSTSYTYDVSGNILTETDRLNNTVTNTYDNNGYLVAVTDARGNKTGYTYDDNGNLASVTDAYENITKYKYDKEDRLVEVTNAKGDSKKFVYDTAGRMIEAVDELGNSIKMKYDENGNVTKIKDAYDVTVTTTEYDNMNNPKVITDALGNKVTSNYDSLGRLVEVVDQLNRSTKYTYDAMNRLTKVVDPLEGESSQTYDNEGNLKSYTDPNGNTTSYVYDVAGRLVSETTAIGSKRTYGYGAMNLLETFTNGREQITTYNYDAEGQVESFTDQVGTVEYTYGENGNVLTVTDEKGTITREYDKLNRITKYTDFNGNVVEYSYDALGNLVALTYPGGKIVRYEYDAASNLKSVIDWNERTTEYEYDKNSRLIKTTNANGTIQTYTYDAAGQVLQQKDVDASGNVINQYDYTYDAIGNVTVEESTYEAQPYLVTNAVMTYDSGNRLLTYNGQTVKYDADGNMTYGPLNGQMVEYTYDCRNRLISAGNTTYEYDAENNRTAVVEDGKRTEYIIDPNAYLSKLLIQKDAEGKETYFIYGMGLIGQEDEDGYKTYHFDRRGSTTAITDENGVVTDRFDYGPYGELVNHAGDTDTPFLYNGRDGVMTDNNGLYYMRARYYNPEIKRFINQDILAGSINDGRTLNRYAYVNGNPVSLTDPFGLSPSIGGMGIVHGLLDLISMVDPFGVADLINAGIYALEGDTFNAMLSLACAAVPAFLDAGAKGLKWGTKAFKATKAGQKLVNSTSKVFKYSSRVTKTIKTAICRTASTKYGKILKSKVAWDAVAGAGVSAAGQKIVNGEVDWLQVGKDAVVSAVAGKITRKLTGASDFIDGFCFTADTLIATKVGSKQIKDVEVGDEVYSANPETGEKGLKKVTQVFVNETDTLIHVFVGDEEIRTTPTHPFWVEGKGWIDAGYLVAGDKLRLYNGELLEVERVEVECLDEVIKVYNFEVEDWHTYYVSGSEVLVHNACKKKLSDDFILGNNRKESNMLINEYDNIKLGNGTPRIDPRTGRQTIFQANEIKNRTGGSRNIWEGSLEWDVLGSANELRILQRPDGKFGYVTRHDYSKVKLFPAPWFPDGGKY